jgi:VanZ family protein
MSTTAAALELDHAATDPVLQIARASRRRLAIGVVAVYASMLILGTHWPRLQLPQLPTFFSLDKVLHFSGYGMLTLLLLSLPTGIFRRPEGGYRSPAWLAATCIFLAVACVSFLDEVTQPLVSRDMDAVDWACDVSGSLTALILVAGAIAIGSLSANRSATIQSRSHVVD